MEDYKSSLILTCWRGISGRLVWTPALDTADTVYYQVNPSSHMHTYTHAHTHTY